MSPEAREVTTKTIGPDQSYTWGRMEAKFGKIRKYAEIEYFWHGSVWDRVAIQMRKRRMKQTDMSFYKGASVDERTKTVKLRGEFVREYVADRHREFWRSFFNCVKDEQPVFMAAGKKVQLPSIAGDDDSLRFFVNGNDLASILLNDEDDYDEAA